MGVKLREHSLSCAHVTRTYQSARNVIWCHPPSTRSHTYSLRKNWTVVGEIMIKDTAERRYTIILGNPVSASMEYFPSLPSSIELL